MKKTTVFIRAALLSFTLYFSCPVMAQDFGDIDFEDDAQDVPVPFDSGICVLIAAGLIYGGVKAYSTKNAKDKETIAAA